MLHTYTTNTNPSYLVENVKCILIAAIDNRRSPHQLMVHIEALLQDNASLTGFKEFVNRMAQRDAVWCPWADFVLINCDCYITLYLAIQSSNWNLRVSSLKRMAPLFVAFDRNTYEWIIPRHLADLKQYPVNVLQCLEAGAFTVSTTGRKFHSVAFDEAHEMCINKDMKSAVIHPSDEY